MIRKILLLCLALGLFPTEADGQEPIQPSDSTSLRGISEATAVERCLQTNLSDGMAMVTGVVRDSASGVALPGAHVSISWDRGPDRPLAELSATVDDEGSYGVCPVPTGVPLAVSATFPRRRAEGTVTLPPDRVILRLDFSLTGQDPPRSDQPSRISLVETGRGGEFGTVTGTVRDQASGAPLVGAQVIVHDLGIGTVTEPGGRFRIDGVPPGEYVLRAEHLGFRAAEEPLVFEEVANFAAVVWLVPQAISMESLQVRASSESEEAARSAGASRYRVTREDFERRPAASLTDVLRARVPGIRILRDRRGCPVLSTRKGAALIVLDGVPFRDGCILNEIEPMDIELVEVLSSVAASTRWGSLGGNGVIEITTRRR